MLNVLQYMPFLEGEEIYFIQNLVKDYDEQKLIRFSQIYASRRKDSQTILLTTLIGFVAVSGVQRFLLGQIGMGLLYLFTGGLCLIGTIVDLVKHKTLAFEYNQKQALELNMMMRSGF
ncbi:hypothetical protein BROC_00823 [Candidatus Brocadiaceae bacterium]|nr:hypothetical protein BROC_00823 [Candidatus Brocadiaceae bacterium]